MTRLIAVGGPDPECFARLKRRPCSNKSKIQIIHNPKSWEADRCWRPRSWVLRQSDHELTSCNKSKIQIIYREADRPWRPRKIRSWVLRQSDHGPICSNKSTTPIIHKLKCGEADRCWRPKSRVLLQSDHGPTCSNKSTIQIIRNPKSREADRSWSQ
jgi:hypothetical protein